MTNFSKKVSGRNDTKSHTHTHTSRKIVPGSSLTFFPLARCPTAFPSKAEDEVEDARGDGHHDNGAAGLISETHPPVANIGLGRGDDDWVGGANKDEDEEDH